MFWDNHMHSNFSGDCEATPLSMIEAAKSKNLFGITFTDHLDLDYKEEPGLFDLDIPSYFSTMLNISLNNSSDNFTILTGIEIGLQPQIANQNKAIALSQDFDFIIGSTHVIDGQDPYYDQIWNEHASQYVLNRYYQCILENIEAFSDFDSIAHLDYAFRYVKDKSLALDTYTEYSEIIDAILDVIISKDKALEINTGAYRKGYKQPNPCSQIIRRYHEKGGKLITIGADAHFPEHVACDFDKLTPLLNDCGFTEYAVYKKRSPILYKF